MTEVRTRFPPEPNGYLHLGHVKAMLWDFEAHPGCDCTLRLDDTNPEVEKQEYVDAILEDVAWLGFRSARVTYTSDYFEALFGFAERLIREGRAYVDFSTADAIKEGRATGVASEWREREPAVHLAEFHRMAAGDYADGTCVLRLKIDMAHENACMRDPIAYRIKRDVAHYRTGARWKVYPSYDYSHGIVDALEGITHSYCTSEFYIRRPQYMWPVEVLGLVPATVVEFGRLNVEGVTLSKRKIIPLVESGALSGFDDPRLFTIRGLRRRGFTPAVLRCLAGLSSGERKDTELSRDVILHHLRTELTATAPKAFAVVDPLECVVASEKMDTERRLWIERSDFRVVDSPDFYRLAPGKTVRLRYDNFIEYVHHELDAEGRVSRVWCREVEPEKPKKVKGIIHWLPVEGSRGVLFDLYDDVSVECDKVVRYGYVSGDLDPETCRDAIQFERVGFFRFDRRAACLEVPIFLRITGLADKFSAKQ